MRAVLGSQVVVVTLVPIRYSVQSPLRVAVAVADRVVFLVRVAAAVRVAVVVQETVLLVLLEVVLVVKVLLVAQVLEGQTQTIVAVEVVVLLL